MLIGRPVLRAHTPGVIITGKNWPGAFQAALSNPHPEWQAGSPSPEWSVTTAPGGEWLLGSPASEWSVTTAPGGEWQISRPYGPQGRTAMLQILQTSTSYVDVDVWPTEVGNPTTLPVSMAFVADYSAITNSTTWYTASWATNTTGAAPWTVRCLVGPNAATGTLTPGAYQVVVQIQNSPETWEGIAGQLMVVTSTQT